MKDFESTKEELIDEAIEDIESEWIEYNNGSKTKEDAQKTQRFLVNELLRKLDYQKRTTNDHARD